MLPTSKADQYARIALNFLESDLSHQNKYKDADKYREHRPSWDESYHTSRNAILSAMDELQSKAETIASWIVLGTRLRDFVSAVSESFKQHIAYGEKFYGAYGVTTPPF